MKFPEHAKAHELLDGLIGIEIGASAHNPFNIPWCTYVDKYPGLDTHYKKEEMIICGEALVPEVVAPAKNLPFPDGSLGYILSSHVLEHCWDVLGTLKHWEDKIYSGGYIFCIVPRMDLCFDADKNPTMITDLMAKRDSTIQVNEDKHWSFWTHQLVLDVFREMGWGFPYYMESPDLKVGNGICFVYKKK